jgi:hypothetical protein
MTAKSIRYSRHFQQSSFPTAAQPRDRESRSDSFTTAGVEKSLEASEALLLSVFSVFSVVQDLDLDLTLNTSLLFNHRLQDFQL